MAKYVNSDNLKYAIDKIKALLNGKANTNHNHNVENLTNYSSRVYDPTLSRTANTFLAAPNGSNGAGTFRKIAEADLPTEMANHAIPYYKTFVGKSGTEGYIKMINIDMSGGTYMTQPLTFYMSQRNNNGVCQLSVLFSQSDKAGSAAVSKFEVSGGYVGLYIVKTASDKFSIYAKKSEPYDSIALYGYYKGLYMRLCKIDFVDEAASALPSGYIKASWGGNVNYSVSADHVNNSLSIQLNGGTATTFNGSAGKSINITPSSIGASASNHTHSYLPLSGGTMTGTISKSSNGGTFITARDRSTILNNGTISSDAFYPIITSRSKAGTWSIGTLENSLFFVYGSDTNYNSKTNRCTTINLSPERNMNINAESANVATKTKAYFRNIGNAGQNKWVCLGIIKIDTAAKVAFINFYSGNGYNATTSQNSFFRIMIKRAWQSTASAAGACGVTCIAYNASTTKIKVIATAADTYKVYLNMPWEYSSGTIEVSGDYSSFTESTEILSSAPTGNEQGVAMYTYGSAAWKNISYGTSAPSGTANTGDIYIQYS